MSLQLMLAKLILIWLGEIIQNHSLMLSLLTIKLLINIRLPDNIHKYYS